VGWRAESLVATDPFIRSHRVHATGGKQTINLLEITNTVPSDLLGC
jgi:hypothetical protein